MPRLGDLYAERLDRALYGLDSGTQYAFLNAFVRSILQTAAVASLDYCFEEVDDIEQTDLPELAAALLSPSDGALGRVINVTLPLIQQSGWPACSRAWFAPSQDLLDGQSTPPNRRVDAWVKHRNDRPAHGVVAQDTVREALSWLPKLARDLLAALADLLPDINSDGALTLPRAGIVSSPSVAISSLRLHDDKVPIVIRSVSARGPSWRVSYQTLDVDVSPEGSYELAPSAPLIALTRFEQRLYRLCTLTLQDGGTWKPFVRLPARQTPVFEGRREQLSALADWMNDGDSRACNVFGDGGIGKTTLVVEYLHGILSQELEAPAWRPELISFFSAKETRWGPDGLQQLRGAVPAVEDAAREIARCYEERLDRSWFDGDAKQVVDRAATLMSGLGLKRDSVLLVLDNAETLARTAEEEEALGKIIAYMARRLCRVLVTSRRREKMEAQPIEVPPLPEEEASRLLRRLAIEYSALPLKQSGDAHLKKVARQLNGRPLLLDVVARLVGKFGYSVDRGVESTLQLAAGDLGTFLYEDAWARIGAAEQMAFLVIGQLGGTVSGDVIGWACGELSVPHSQVLSAFEETRFGALLDYGAHYDLSMDPSARAFLAKKFGGADSGTRATVERAAARVQKKHRDLLAAQMAPVNDRVTRAFRTDAAKAAHRAAEAGQTDDALRWYEEAVQADRGNAALLDRFAWYLMKQCRDLSRALQVAREACAADPNDADAHFTAGMIHARLANPAQADEQIALALRLGKPAHLCALQRAQARSRAVEDLLSTEPIDVDRIDALVREGQELVSSAQIGVVATSLGAKHEVERAKTERRFARHTARIAGLRKSRRFSSARGDD